MPPPMRRLTAVPRPMPTPHQCFPKPNSCPPRGASDPRGRGRARAAHLASLGWAAPAVRVDRSIGCLALVAKMNGQFWHGQLKSALSCLAAPSGLSQVRYTRFGHRVHGPPDPRNQMFMLCSIVSSSCRDPICQRRGFVDRSVGYQAHESGDTNISHAMLPAPQESLCEHDPHCPRDDHDDRRRVHRHRPIGLRGRLAVPSSSTV